MSYIPTYWANISVFHSRLAIGFDFQLATSRRQDAGFRQDAVTEIVIDLPIVQSHFACHAISLCAPEARLKPVQNWINPGGLVNPEGGANG